MPLLFSSKVLQQTKKNVETLSKKVFNFKKSFKSIFWKTFTRLIKACREGYLLTGDILKVGKSRYIGVS
jgi:hypothetical protein